MEKEPGKIHPQLERWRQLKTDPEALMSHIVDYISTSGRGLLSFAKLHQIAYRSLLDWIHADPQRKARHQAALIDSAWSLYEQAAEILDQPPRLDDNGKVDNGWVTLQRARSDVRKWQASKMLPSKFGDKLEVSAPHVYDLAAAMARGQARLERLNQQRLDRLNCIPEFLTTEGNTHDE